MRVRFPSSACPSLPKNGRSVPHQRPASARSAASRRLAVSLRDGRASVRFPQDSCAPQVPPSPLKSCATGLHWGQRRPNRPAMRAGVAGPWGRLVFGWAQDSLRPRVARDPAPEAGEPPRVGMPAGNRPLHPCAAGCAREKGWNPRRRPRRQPNWRGASPPSRIGLRRPARTHRRLRPRRQAPWHQAPPSRGALPRGGGAPAISGIAPPNSARNRLRRGPISRPAAL